MWCWTATARVRKERESNITEEILYAPERYHDVFGESQLAEYLQHWSSNIKMPSVCRDSLALNGCQLLEYTMLEYLLRCAPDRIGGVHSSEYFTNQW